MLSIRCRGTIWYVRGTVKAAGRREIVREQSTSCTTEREARSYADHLEKVIAARLQLGIGAKHVRPAPRFSDALVTMIEKRKPKSYDTYRLERMLDQWGERSLDKIGIDEWNAFIAAKLPGRSVNTFARYHDLLKAVFEDSAWAWPRDADGSPTIKRGGERMSKVAWLELATADKLLDAYSREVHPIATLARFQGARAQELLQLDRKFIDLSARRAWIERSKNGEARWISLHDRSVAVLERIMATDTRPAIRPDGSTWHPLFLSRLGKPYPDTRGDSNTPYGGNPLKNAHAGACRRAGVTAFRWHDWRHHWATWFVRSGGDLISLMQEGGWKEISMVQIYAAGDMEHRAAQIAKLK